MMTAAQRKHDRACAKWQEYLMLRHLFLIMWFRRRGILCCSTGIEKIALSKCISWRTYRQAHLRDRDYRHWWATSTAWWNYMQPLTLNSPWPFRTPPKTLKDFMPKSRNKR